MKHRAAKSSCSNFLEILFQESTRETQLTQTFASLDKLPIPLRSSYDSTGLDCSSNVLHQSMPRDLSSHMCASPHTCKIPSTSEESPTPTSLSTMQLHMPYRSFVVATATLVIFTFCFQNSALSCFIVNQTFDMLQQQLWIQKSWIACAIPNS